MSLLLGVDEGTSAVKAVLYDEDLGALREARREKPLSNPQAGWVEQDPEAVLKAVIEAVEVPGHPFALGVQWHPERPEMRDDDSLRAGSRALFAAFVQACRAR